jgi:all-trans-retinol dehydrogenase (NAD+)
MTALAGKKVLITGVASGIGWLMAHKFAKKGATIIGWDIREDNLARLAEELRSTGAGHRMYTCDITQREGVYATAERVLGEVGHVEILINNAGVVSGKRFLDLPDEQIERTVQVNTLALFWATRAFLPAMIAKNSGHVVTIASAAGLVGISGLADYCASKFGAVGFDEALRGELRKVAPRVKTTLVCPYYIDTGMFEGVRTRFPLLLPILGEEQVTERIVAAVQRDERLLVMPPLVRLVPMFRLLPVGIFDSIAELLGLNVSMDTFQGREGEGKTGG